MERSFIPSVDLSWQNELHCGRADIGRLNWRQPLLLLIVPAMLMACRPEAETTHSIARPVRTVVAEKRIGATPITFTGSNFRHLFPGNSFTVLRLKSKR